MTNLPALFTSLVAIAAKESTISETCFCLRPCSSAMLLASADFVNALAPAFMAFMDFMDFIGAMLQRRTQRAESFQEQP